MTRQELSAELRTRGLDVNQALVSAWSQEDVDAAVQWIVGGDCPDFLYAFDYGNVLPQKIMQKPAKQQKTLF